MRGQIIEKGGDKYLVRVYLGRIDGKKKYASEQVRGTKKFAEAVLTKKLRELDTQTLVVPSKESLSAYLDGWLDGKAGIGTKTKLDYKHRLDKDVIPFIGALSLAKITPLVIQSLYGSLSSDRKLSPRTVRYTHTVLSQAFDKAVELGMLSKNPCAGVELPKMPRKGSAAQVLGFEQTAHLLKITAGDPLHALWRLLLTAGLRPQEALVLRWDDLDVQQKTLTIQRALHQIDGGRYEVTADLKTDSSARSVVLSQETVDVLLAHKRKQAAHALEMGEKFVRTGYIFTNRYGHHQDIHWVRKSWKAALAKAGLPELRLYDTRHTHLTQLLSSGVNAKAVADRSGHSDPVVLLNTYAHVLPAVAAHAADVIETQMQEATKRQAAHQ